MLPVQVSVQINCICANPSAMLKFAPACIGPWEIFLYLSSPCTAEEKSPISGQGGDLCLCPTHFIAMCYFFMR